MKFALLAVAVLLGAPCFPQSPIDAREEVQIGGIRQYITIQGKDNTLPLLLFLHGGPGGSVMSYADRFTDQLREHFIVVQWDQRETGKTLELNPSPVPLTLEVFRKDTHEMIELLLARFGQERLYLVGHSWGTSLGFYIARAYPKLLCAYIAIGPMINQQESEHIALSMMMAKARKEGNERANLELASVHIPFRNGEQLYYHRKWLQDLTGSRRALSRRHVEQWATTWLPLFNEASKEDLTATLREVACPLYIFAGKRDYQTNSSIAEDYYQMVKAPLKGFYWFDTGHSIPSSAPGRMQDLIIKSILPETISRSAF